MNDIINKVASLGGTISTTDISHLSEYKQVLRAKERGDLIRLRHGVYAAPEALLNTMIDVERIIPNGVVCLYNAWTYHQLSTTVPPAFCIAIANKRKVVLPHALPIELYYWKKENLEFGVMDVEMSGYYIRMTDMERSVCDAVKYRNKIGLEVCSEVIRNYLKKQNRNLSQLAEYAKRLRVANILKNYLEIAIE
jgi:predicted transcriptional regulator of viral defense system